MLPEKFPPITSADEKAIARLVETGSAIANEPFLGTGPEAESQLRAVQNVIDASSLDEIEHAERALDEYVGDTERVTKLCARMHERRGWTETETIAMLDVLRHGVRGALRAFRFAAPDEGEISAQSGDRSIRKLIRLSIQHDYGNEVVIKVAPLVESYLSEAGKDIQLYRSVFLGDSPPDDSAATMPLG